RRDSLAAVVRRNGGPRGLARARARGSPAGHRTRRRPDTPSMSSPASVSPPASFWRDLSMPAIVAGFVTVLVGFTSSAVIVFEAARALGANDAQVASWMWALGIGMGLTCIVPSLRWRVPVVT